MPAQQKETVWTFFLVSGTATAGQVVCMNAAQTGALVATSANRTAAARRACAVAITSSDSINPAFEGQVVGPLDPAIANVGAGLANEAVRVSTTGSLERVASPSGSDQVVGICDADGAVYLDFVGAAGASGGATLTGTTNGVLSLTGASAATADGFWTIPTAGNLLGTYQANSSNQGGITFRGTGGDVSGMPNIGTLRYSDQLADNGGLNSITIAAYYRSSGAANVQQAAIGISGGHVFLGDASNPLTPIDLYGNANITGVMGSAGFLFLTGSNYSSLGSGTTFLAIDGTGKVTVATPASGPSVPISMANGGFGASVAASVGIPKFASGSLSFLTIPLTPVNGGTGQDFSASTGLVLFSSGTASVVARVNPGGAVSAMAALAIDWSLSNSFTKTLANSGNTITFSNVASGQTITVRLTGGGASSTVTWPTVKWKGGVAPTQTTSGIDVYTFWNDGTSTYGSVVQNMS